MRLLTEEEMSLLEWESGTLNMAFIDNHKAEIKALNEAQRDLTRKETLKAVGEWLDVHWTVTGGTIREARFANSIIASLLRGEMPEKLEK